MNQKIFVEGLFPTEADKTADGYNVRVWNRCYKIAKSPVFDSIMSGGEELLASSIRVVGKDGANPLVWDYTDETVDKGTTTVKKLEDGDTLEKRFIRATQSERYVLDTFYSVDYDGCVRCRLSIMPRGGSVAAGFGLGVKKEQTPKTLDEFWLEIPLRKDAAKFYQYFPVTDAEYHHIDAIEGGSISLEFAANVFVGNDDRGLSVFFDSDKNWNPKDKSKAIEIVTGDDEVVLRYHLLDSDPVIWRDKGENGMGTGLLPISFEFGIQATPIKPFPQNPYKEHNLHMDCFKKVFVDYETFLFNQELKTDGDETMMDRIERLGVNTLYLHEKWNDIQNSVDLTEESAARLKHIVDDAHSRGIKVIPYFGYELSSLSPLFNTDYRKYMRFVHEGMRTNASTWYRYPWQRAVPVCFASEYGDYFLNGIDRLMDKYGFDGIYLDGTLTAKWCINEEHGCGYRDEEGKLKPTYNVWKTREFARKLYEIVHKHGGTVNYHAAESLQTFVLTFVDSIWDGECIQIPFLHGKVDTVPEIRFRCAYAGRNIGIPVQMLCYSNPPEWTFHQATATTLAFGVLPKPVDIGEPLEEMTRIHKVYDAFPMENAHWKPFYENDVMCDNDLIRVSYFESGRKILAIIANMKNIPSGNVKIKFPFALKNVTDSITGEKLKTIDNSIEVSFDKFDYLLVDIETDCNEIGI